MLESEYGGMEAEAAKRIGPRFIAGISRNRVSDFGKLGAYLVLSSRFEPYVEKGIPGRGCIDPPVRQSPLGARRASPGG